MLVGVLVVTLTRVFSSTRVAFDLNSLITVHQATRTTPTRIMPVSGRRRTGARGAAAAVGSCVQDIEEAPVELLEGYRRHQTTYHNFTPEEVLMSLTECSRRRAPPPTCEHPFPCWRYLKFKLRLR